MLALAIIATVLMACRWVVELVRRAKDWGDVIGSTIAHGFVITVIWLLFVF